MDKELIARAKLFEQLAISAGFRINPQQPGEIFTESEDEISAQLKRFAALVSERCALICEEKTSFAYDDADDSGAFAIREAFKD